MDRRKSRQTFRGGRVFEEEARRLDEIRRKTTEDFPPDPDCPRPVEARIGARIRAVREAKGLTRYAVAQLAKFPNPATVRDIEYGRDAKLSGQLHGSKATTASAAATAIGHALPMPYPCARRTWSTARPGDRSPTTPAPAKAQTPEGARQPLPARSWIRKNSAR